MVGIYAPNQDTQRVALWGYFFRPYVWAVQDLFMGDINMCVYASQSTSEHSIMDDPEQLASYSLAMEVRKFRHGCKGMIQVLLFNLLNIDKLESVR